MWRDLVPVAWPETIPELLLPLSWLIASLLVAGHGHYLIALGLSFTFFLTGAPAGS